MSRIECKYFQLVLHIWQGYLRYSYYFIFDRIVCVLMTLPMRTLSDHQLIIRNLNLISVQSWTYLVYWDLGVIGELDYGVKI